MSVSWQRNASSVGIVEVLDEGCSSVSSGSVSATSQFVNMKASAVLLPCAWVIAIIVVPMCEARPFSVDTSSIRAFPVHQVPSPVSIPSRSHSSQDVLAVASSIHAVAPAMVGGGNRAYGTWGSSS